MFRCIRRKVAIFDRRGYLFWKLPEKIEGDKIPPKPEIIKISKEERAFLQKLEKEEDDVGILAYSEWLEEHGMILAAWDIRHRLALAIRREERVKLQPKKRGAGLDSAKIQERINAIKAVNPVQRTKAQKKEWKELDDALRNGTWESEENHWEPGQWWMDDCHVSNSNDVFE